MKRMQALKMLKNIAYLGMFLRIDSEIVRPTLYGERKLQQLLGMYMTGI